MGDKEELACPNCGAKKFVFLDSTRCKCDYCNSEWKLEDILGFKKFVVETQSKESVKKHLISSLFNKNTNENAAILIALFLFFLLIFLVMKFC